MAATGTVHSKSYGWVRRLSPKSPLPSSFKASLLCVWFTSFKKLILWTCKITNVKRVWQWKCTPNCSYSRIISTMKTVCLDPHNSPPQRNTISWPLHHKHVLQNQSLGNLLLAHKSLTCSTPTHPTWIILRNATIAPFLKSCQNWCWRGDPRIRALLSSKNESSGSGTYNHLAPASEDPMPFSDLRGLPHRVSLTYTHIKIVNTSIF